MEGVESAGCLLHRRFLLNACLTLCSGEGKNYTIKPTKLAPKQFATQGDCLGGCVAAFLGWIRRGKRDDPADAESQEPSPYLLACYGAATIVRRAAKAAYEAKGRAMGAPDVVDQLGPVVDEMVGDRPRAVL